MSVRGNWDQRRVERVSRMGEIDRRKFVALTGASAAALAPLNAMNLRRPICPSRAISPVRVFSQFPFMPKTPPASGLLPEQPP